MWFQKKKLDVICIGSASKDIFFPTDEGIIIETPEDLTAKQKIAFELGGKYRVKDRYEAIGGVAANVSCGLSRLGFEVASYSCIGDDEIGRFVLQSFNDEGVSTDYVTRYPDAKTDLSAIIVMTQNGERTIFHNRDANERLVVVEERLRQAEWFFVSALNGDWKKNLETVVVAHKKSGARLALNPGQHNIREDAAVILATLPEVQVLLLNKDEAIELVMKGAVPATPDQLDDEQFLLTTLHSFGAKTIGMTDGKRGAWGSDGQVSWFCPISTRGAVLDSTGCGDAFGSGFMAAHLAGKSLPEALQYGIANSGSVVGFYGAIEGLLNQEEMTELCSKVVPKQLK